MGPKENGRQAHRVISGLAALAKNEGLQPGVQENEGFAVTDPADTKAQAVDHSTILAVERTLLAYDRTLLAWIRTAIALITFGFTIYKFFQLELSRVAARPERLIGPPEFAFLMILAGLVSLLLATLAYRGDLKALRAQYSVKLRMRAGPLAAMVSVLGLVAMLAVLFRQ
jgi:putative membrane protein